MRKAKKILVVAVVLVMILSCCAFTTVNVHQDSASIQAVLDFIEAMDSQDWNMYISLLPSNQQASMTYFVNDVNNINTHSGILNIQSAEIDSINEIASSVSEPNKKVYLVGINFDVYENTPFTYDGLSYYQVTTVEEDGTWKVESIPRASVEQISSIYHNPDAATQKALVLQKLRNAGVLIDNDGMVMQIDSTSPLSNDVSIKVNSKLSSSMANSLMSTIANDNQFSRPAALNVWMANLANPYKKTVDFYDWCKSVLYNEWGVSNLTTGELHPMAALEAGAQCVKMRGWYNYHHQAAWSYGCHVNNNVDGRYVEGREHSRATQAVNNVGGIGIKNYSGNVMNTYYSRGSYSTPGIKGGGNCSQLGSVNLAKNNPSYTWQNIIHYYFDYASNVCPGGPCSWFYYD